LSGRIRRCPKGHPLDPNWETCPHCEAEKQLRLSDASSLLNDTNDRVIAIDGWAGAGKSHLASLLKGRVAIPIVRLDDLLTPGRGKFVDRIRHQDLDTLLKKRPVIVEGICVLQALEQIGATPDILIYVKAVDDRGQWVHEEILDNAPSSATSVLSRELIEYHRAYSPHTKADYIFPNPLRERWGVAMGVNDQIQIDIQYIKEKTKLAITLAIGGMLSLIVGLLVLLKGVSGTDETLVKLSGAELSAKGLGGVIMLTSSLWGYLAYKARPVYSRAKNISEKRDPATGVIERIESESSTAVR